MKIVFMGTPEFAVPTFEALVASPHQVVAAVCQPDKKKGRGGKMQSPEVKLSAVAHSVPVLQPARIRSKDGTKQAEFVEQLRAFEPDAIVVVAYGKILPREVLELPRYGCFNVHASLLPKYRGAAPIQWAIASGETETGVSIMQMDEGLDTGDVLAMERMELLSDDDAQSVSNALSVMGAAAMLGVLNAIDSGNAPEPQSQSGMGEPTFAPILRREDGVIDWERSTEQILCQIHGFRPWPGSYSYRTGEKMPFHILAAQPFHGEREGVDEEGLKAAAEAEPGEITRVEKGRGFVVRTGTGELLVTEAKPPNKAAMSGAAAVNGRLVMPGQRFVGEPAG